MSVSNDPQELARRFNGDEAVWRRYQQKRDLRRLRSSPGLFPVEVLDRFDWLEAIKECRVTRCVGKLIL